MRLLAFVCLLARLLKTRAWIWMKCCVSTDVGTWTNWLTFEPDPDYNPDAGTGLLSPLSYKRWYAEFYVGKIRRIRIGRCSDVWFYNGFIHWASEPSKHLCRRYMRSTECHSSSKLHSSVGRVFWCQLSYLLVLRCNFVSSTVSVILFNVAYKWYARKIWVRGHSTLLLTTFSRS